MRRIDCKLPVRKISTGGGAGGGTCGCGRSGGRCCCAGAAGGIGGVGIGFAGVEVGGEEGVVVIARHVQGGEGLFDDCCAEGVAFVGCAVVAEDEADVYEVDGEGIVG